MPLNRFWITFALFLAALLMDGDLRAEEACGGQGQPKCAVASFDPENLGKPSQCRGGAIYHDAGDGSCWACPDGFVRPPGATYGPGSCQKIRGIQRRSAEDIRKPPQCPEESVLDVREQSCFACPVGYHRTLLPISGEQGCQKGTGPDFAQAMDFGPLVCPDNGIVDINSNGCFRCPEGFKRDEKQTIDHLDACMREVFVKTLATKVEAPTCPPGSDRAEAGCIGCPNGSVYDPTSKSCRRLPCAQGLVEDEAGHCQQPSAVKTEEEPLGLPDETDAVDSDDPALPDDIEEPLDGDDPGLLDLFENSDDG